MNHKMSARLFGIFFIFSFLSYAIGMGLMEIVQNTQSLPDDIIAAKHKIIAGGILTGFFHTLFNLGLLVIMFNTLKHANHILSCFYVVSGSFGTIMLALGTVFLLLPMSVSENAGQSYGIEPMLFQAFLRVCSNGNFYSYHLGMAVWGVGGVILCSLLYQSKLVPEFFPVFGLAGYLIFITGTLLALFGYPYGVMLSIPGGLFEIILGVWLIIKGFSVKNAV